MDQDASKIIEKQFVSLPRDVQDALRSTKIEKRVAEIATLHNLHIDQTDKLHQEILFFLLGLVLPAEFTTRVASALSIDRVAADSIARDADRLIFTAVRTSLQRIHVAVKTGESSEAPEPEVSIMTTSAGNEIPIPKTLLTTQQTPTHTGPIPNIRTMPKDIAKIKMGESIRLPKEEIAMNYSSDPYREKPE